MKHPIQQIRSNMLGVTAIDGIAMVSSRDVAAMFEKRHDNVLQAIESADCSASFRNLNFKVSYYREGKGKYKEILMTKNGFAFVVMGFTGKKAAKFKEAYITRFDEMEQFIYSRNLARLEYPELTEMIKLMHEKPKFYHFSNEADMINKIVLGMSAKQFRQENNLEKDAAIRDYMTLEQAEMIQRLQKVDVGFVVAIPDFGMRKAALKTYYDKLQFAGRLTA